jgi:hypothetical protein
LKTLVRQARFLGTRFIETLPEEVERKENPREFSEINKKKMETHSSERAETSQL